jgi:hypothetical protein
LGSAHLNPYAFMMIWSATETLSQFWHQQGDAVDDLIAFQQRIGMLGFHDG